MIFPPAGPLFVRNSLNHIWKCIFGNKPSDHIRPFHFCGTKLWCISTWVPMRFEKVKDKKNSKIELPKWKIQHGIRGITSIFWVWSAVGSTNMAMSGICFDVHHLNFPIRLLFNQLVCLSKAATAHVRQTRSLCTPKKNHLFILSFDSYQTDFVQNPLDKACIISIPITTMWWGTWVVVQSTKRSTRPAKFDGKKFS